MSAWRSTSQLHNLMQPPWQSSMPLYLQMNQETVSSVHRVTIRSVPLPPALDAVIVAVETQDTHLASKRTWTRKMMLITDGDSPIEVEDLPETIKRINSLNIAVTIVYAHLYLLYAQRVTSFKRNRL